MDVESLHPMAETAKYQNRIELLQGTLDMLILQALQGEPMHKYAIAAAMEPEVQL